MKIKRLIALIAGAACSIGFLTGCSIVKSLEEELNVVFECEGEFIDSGVVTQFKNIKSPDLKASYIPDGYRFLGWTCYQENQLDLTNATNFKTQYIGAGRMVHYMDVAKFAENKTVICNALIMDPNDIPKEYHYAVVAWYDKVATSGLDANKMETIEGMVKQYLTSEGVSQDDINSVLFRGYTGNVGASTGQIVFDGDVDLMFGWAANISSTGVVPAESVLETDTFVVPGLSTPTRYIHRLTDSEGCLKVMEYLKSDAVKKFFDPNYTGE